MNEYTVQNFEPCHHDGKTIDMCASVCPMCLMESCPTPVGDGLVLARIASALERIASALELENATA